MSILTPFNAGNAQISITMSSDPGNGGAGVFLSRYENSEFSKYIVVFGEFANNQLVAYTLDENGTNIDSTTLADLSVPQDPTTYILAICGNQLLIYDDSQNLIAEFNGELISQCNFTGPFTQYMTTTCELNSVDADVIQGFCENPISSGTSSSSSTSFSTSSSAVTPQGLSVGAIIGIVIGCIVGAILIIGASAFGYNAYKKNKLLKIN